MTLIRLGCERKLQQVIKKITNLYLTKPFGLCEFGFSLAIELRRWGINSEKGINVIDWGWWCGVCRRRVYNGSVRINGAGLVRGVMEVEWSWVGQGSYGGEGSYGGGWEFWVALTIVWYLYQVERIRGDEGKERRQTWKKIDQVGPIRVFNLITEVPLKLVFVV